MEQWLSGCDELVAGHDHAHARRAMTAHLGHARGRDGRQGERAQGVAGGDDDSPGGHVRAARAHVIAYFDRRVERDPIAVDAGDLDRNDGVGSGRQRRPGRNRHRRVRLEPGGVVAREGLPGHRELLARIGRAHGITVHRRVVERRQVVCGVHVGGDHQVDW